jgi:hypothetical protein
VFALSDLTRTVEILKMNARSTSMAVLSLGTLLLATSAAMADRNLAPGPDGLTDITAAIANANDGETLWLAPGEYVHTLDATQVAHCKSLRFVGTGANPGDTVIRSARFRHHIGGWQLRDNGQMNYTFQNMTFASQASLEQTMDGLYIGYATVRFVDCRFDRLQSVYVDGLDRVDEFETFGAMMLDSCEASLVRCQFSDNGLVFDRATDQTAVAEGGAILMYNSKVTINDSQFEGNYVRCGGHASDAATSQSKAAGGAIYATRGSLTIRNTTFDENVASGIEDRRQPDLIAGGAICSIAMNWLELRECTLNDNAANQGGGAQGQDVGLGGALYVYEWDGHYGYHQIMNTTFETNDADVTGGAIWLNDLAHVKLYGCTFECNSLEQVAGPYANAGNNEFHIFCLPIWDPADLNFDHYVTWKDVYVIFWNWGKVESDKQAVADLDQDGVVGVKDYYQWLDLFLKS